MSSWNKLPQWLFTALLAAIGGLSGCGQGATAQAGAGEKSPETVGVMIDSVNYSHDRSYKYTLYDLTGAVPKEVGGAIVPQLGSGGEKNCCLALPKQWRPGLKVRLEWQEANQKEKEPEIYKREMEIPRYEQPADLYVAFHPQHDVELVVSAGEPGHPEWKGRTKQTPWDLCVQEFGRKTCKRAIPDYGGLSPGEMQGFCTYLKDEKDDMSLCDVVMRQCVQYYEDDEFCRATLWGKRKPKS